jgi:hypothetical protein
MLPHGGSAGRGSEPTCVGLDGRSACRETRQAARSAKGAPVSAAAAPNALPTLPAATARAAGRMPGLLEGFVLVL